MVWKQDRARVRDVDYRGGRRRIVNVRPTITKALAVIVQVVLAAAADNTAFGRGGRGCRGRSLRFVRRSRGYSGRRYRRGHRRYRRYRRYERANGNGFILRISYAYVSPHLGYGREYAYRGCRRGYGYRRVGYAYRGRRGGHGRRGRSSRTYRTSGRVDIAKGPNDDGAR